jgi:hypothetical protein
MEIEQDILNMLLQGEKILYQSTQSRYAPGGSAFTPNTIYLSNQRILYRDPRLLGLKKDYIDIYYRDINQIRLKKGIFSTEIIIMSRFQSDPIILPAVSKKDAEYIGGMIRKGMASRLEGQKIADLSSAPVIAKQEVIDPMEQLIRLGKIRDSGIISEEEFQQKKKEILERI